MKQAESQVASVKHFMSQVLFSLEDTMTLENAAQFFSSHKLTTAPVLTKNGEILGVMTDFNLLRLLLLCRQKGKKNLALNAVKDELDPVVTIHEDETIVTAFRMMIHSPNHRIYTVHSDKLTGALSPKDLLLYMAGVKQDDQLINMAVKKQLESILKELQETRRMLSDYQQMFNDSPYLMHSVNMEGKIIAANRMIHYVLGYEEGELIGRSIRQMYPPENYRKALQGLQTIKELGFHPLINVVMIKKTGEPVRVDIASTLKKDSKGAPEATITVGRLSDSYRMLNFLQKAARAYNRPKRK